MKIRTTKLIAVDDVQTHPENPNQGDVGAISQSLEYHGGQYRAIVVSEDTGNIVAGNHTYLAARALGETKVLAHLIPGLTHEDEVRIMTGDNQMARLASSDDHLLVELLTELASSDVGLVATGYDGDDIDTLLVNLTQPLDTDWISELEQEHGIGTHGRTIISFGLPDADAATLEAAIAQQGDPKNVAIVAIARHYLDTADG